MKKTALFLGFAMSGSIAAAESPKIMTDIPPVQSLVAMVAGAQAEPGVILDQAGSAHDLALRPSQARALSQAGLIVWIGSVLSPTVDRSLDSLARDAARLTLAEAPGTIAYPYRDQEDFALAAKDHNDHAHDDHEDHSDQEHGHDDHKDHGDHEERADDHDHDHDHAHDGTDPHLWLSPQNALVWLPLIAEALAAQDPQNAATYTENAQTAAADITALDTQIKAILEPVEGRPLLVGHDAFQYFEQAYDLTVIGSVSDSHARDSGPARLAALRDAVQDAQPACILLEPGTDSDLIDAVVGPDVPRVTADPLGMQIAPGAGQYADLLRTMAQAIADCAEG